MTSLWLVTQGRRWLRAARKTIGLVLVLVAYVGMARGGSGFGGGAPELDPGAVGAGALLLACGFFLVLDRSKRDNTP